MQNISIMQLKKANCKNCYKCVRNCPVKAIRIHNHQAQIIEEQCILCERCVEVCPQNAKVEINQIPDIKQQMRQGEMLIASVHPAYLAKYGRRSFKSLEKDLKALGFWKAFEASEGAYLMKTEYEQVLRKREQKLTISASCPVIVRLISKKYPSLIENLAPVLSTMQTHAKYLQTQYPDARIVYISPCISAISEIQEEENHVYSVITFQELNKWMEEEDISVQEEEAQGECYLSRITASSGGLIQAMRPLEGKTYLSVDGLDECKAVLKELQNGKYENCFIEMNACRQGCIGGPSFRNTDFKLLNSILEIRKASLVDGHPDYDRDCKVDMQLALKRDFKEKDTFLERRVSEEQIKRILEEMGKFSKKDELNCGACGYNTCREKAVAVARGKAEVSMCIPYMRERQENFSNIIVNAMPGLLVTVDYDLNVVQMNKAAKDFFDISRKKKMLHEPVGQLMDDYPLVNMISFDKSISTDNFYLPSRNKYVERVMTNDRKNKLILCIMKDVTKEIEQQKKARRARIQAAELADKLAKEQLRNVHLIAELLGETAADTKAAIEKLKETILQETE